MSDFASEIQLNSTDFKDINHLNTRDKKLISDTACKTLHLCPKTSKIPIEEVSERQKILWNEKDQENPTLPQIWCPSVGSCADQLILHKV